MTLPEQTYTLRIWKSPFASVAVSYVCRPDELATAKQFCWWYLLNVRGYPYRRPRWWEWWRWLEERPPKEGIGAPQ